MTDEIHERTFAVLLSLLMLVSVGSAGIAFSGTAAAQSSSDTSVSFGASELAGGPNIDNPTSLQFGPDGRLYVAERFGQIHVLNVTRDGPNDYQVTASETITSVAGLPNHDDQGNYEPGVDGREVTGLVVGGTADNLVLYVGSSDPRVGGGSSGEDTNLDTNSGVVSRLTPTGSGWEQELLVRGLPRSGENHAINGLELDESTNTLYVAAGGNTNQGAISNNFAYVPEYALSTAILEIDLDQIDTNYGVKDAANTDASYLYDLPTLNGTDTPFGGQNGRNMAKLVAGGPVGIYSSGYRNSYDVTLSADGQLYTVDNGPNGGWGDVPVGEGSTGACTNEPNEPGDTLEDHLHLATEGSYGGHPNPTRGNPDGAGLYDENGTKVGNVSGAVYDGYDNPIECEYQGPTEDGSMTSFSASTNGLDEYTASNFDGSMQGDLLTASFDGNVYRVQLDSAGDSVTNKTAQFSSGLSTPLDVTTQGDDQVFNGTVWVADFGGDDIDVFEPADTSGGDTSCDTSDPDGDADGDGYTNADEIDAGTDPCSAASTPSDYDGDNVSNTNDDDDDNDGLLDTEDPFAVDPDNGLSTDLPVEYDFSRDSVPDSLEGLGFTGLMTNGQDYQDLYVPGDTVFGGANPALTVENVKPGDAVNSQNSQQHAYQFGVVAPDEPFTIHAPVTGYPENPQNYQGAGIQLGTGDQDNYLKLVVAANGGTGGLQFAKETGGNFDTISQPDDPAVTEAGVVTDLYLTVYPSNETVVASYTVDDGTEATVGKTTIPSGWIDNGDQGLAVGVIASSYKADGFAVTWNDLEVTAANTTGNQAPTADAGADLTAAENTTADLDGTGSSDPDGDALGYAWNQTAGPEVLLDAQDSPTPSFDTPSVDNDTTLAFELNVSDGNASDTDTVNVTVQDVNASEDENQAPNASFTYSPASPNTSEEVTFDASGSNDSDGSIQSYAWDFDGDGVVENTTSDPLTTYAYPENGTYQATLTVTDNDSATNSTNWMITVEESGSGGDDGSGSSNETVFAVNAGGSAYTASDGTTYEADTNFAGGSTYSTSEAIGNTADDPLYQTERYGDFGYGVPVTNGTYEVTLQFAEIYHGVGDSDSDQVGDRVFDANLEGGTIELNDYDIYADVGSLNATEKTYLVNVTGGQLDLDFVTEVNNAKVSAIEVVQVDSSGGGNDTNVAPNASFAYSPSSPNASEEVTFDGSNSTDADGTIQSYAWDLGDGTTATGETVNHSYDSAGNYTATLTVTDNGSATNSTQQVITVENNSSDGSTSENQPPTANFTYSPTNPNASEEVTFDASESSDSDGLIQSYEWDFDGDGTIDNTTSGPTTAHAYPENGTYTATLTVTDNDSATNSTSREVVVEASSSGGGENQVPNASFTYSPASPNASKEVTFDASDSNDSDGTITSYDWDFDGDGTIENSTSDPITTYTYAENGTYTAILTVTDDNGSNASAQQAITVTDSSSGDGSESSNETVFAVNAGGSAYTASDGTAYEADTNFVGGSTYSTSEAIGGTQDDPLYQTERYGDFTYSVPVTNGTYEVTLQFAEIYFDAANERVFDANLEGGTIELENYDIYAEAGALNAADKTYTVDVTDGELTVQFSPDTNNAKIGAIEVVQVDSSTDGTVNEAPSASFTTSNAPTAGENVTFDASGSNDSDGSITSYAWEFGDGTTATGEVVNHSYDSAGNYTVNLTVTDDDGASNSTSRTVAVEQNDSNGTTANEAPNASFTYSPSSPNASETVTFDGSNSTDADGTIESYEWDLGDGTTATGEVVNHTYAENGTYTVTLTVTDNDSATNSTQQVITVENDSSDDTSENQSPTANFTVDPSEPNVSEEATFDASDSNDTDGTITSYEWDFDGDGTIENTTSEPVTTYAYPENGTYTATLTVIDDGNATDSTSRTVAVTEPTTTDGNEAPSAAFSYTPAAPNASETVTFDASNSTDADGEITEYAWDFDGDGVVENTTSDPVTTYAYPENGTYTATLTVTDNDSATNSTSREVVIEAASSGDSGSNTTSASITINEGSTNIDESTYGAGSFAITNTGEESISVITIDLRSGSLPDMVFDPNGTAGDKVAKEFTVDSGGSATGQTGHQLSNPHDGSPEDGYDTLTVAFDDFEPGESFAFSIDVDPTSIKGTSAPGPNEAGSVSGLELSGSTVTVEGTDGTTVANDAFSDGSNGGSRATIGDDVAPAPSIGVSGVTLDEGALDGQHSAATVSQQGQTIEVSGPADTTVQLLKIEGALFEPDGGAYEPEAYEANSATLVDTQSVALGADGSASVGVTINESGDGLTYFVAVAENAAGDTGRTSNVVVLEHDPNASTNTASVSVASTTTSTEATTTTETTSTSTSTDNTTATTEGTTTTTTTTADGTDSTETTTTSVATTTDTTTTETITTDTTTTGTPDGTSSSTDTDVAPNASFAYSPASPNASEEVIFDASDSSDSDGSIEAYEWDFDGDGTTDTTTAEPTMSFVYAENGTYTAILTVTNDDGDTDTTDWTVAIGESGSGDGSRASSSANLPNGAND